MYKDLLEYIVKNLVAYPEKIEISEVQTEGKVALKLKVAKEDMGRVIGRQGKVANSIRMVMKALGSKDKKKVMIEFMEN